MLRRSLSIALASTGLALAGPASAAEYLQISAPTGVFGNLGVSCSGTVPCAFTNLFNFVTPAGYDQVNVDITSTSASAATNIDFSVGSVTLNGIALTFDALATATEHGFLYNLPLIAGQNNVLSVSGTSGGQASYSGTLAFAASVVPEPGTWMLMIAGIGAIGVALRRRKAAAGTFAMT